MVTRGGELRSQRPALFRWSGPSAPEPHELTVVHTYGVSEAWSSILQQVAKRAIDIVGSLILLVLLGPLLLLIALVTGIASGWPVLFAQSRPGRDGESFRILKFRTMERNAEQRLQILLSEHPALRAEWIAKEKLVNDPRITSFGRMLRRSSLDELPQLVNVLKGDMSLVGPRPVVGDP